MPQLNLKPTHKPVKAYYDSLSRFESLGVTHETAVRGAFQYLLESCGRQFDWTLVPEWMIARGHNKRIYVDGALLDSYKLPHGFWEAKDIDDHLEQEIQRKFDLGYPRDNILFQIPQRAILWQDDRQILDADLTEPEVLIETLQAFFGYQPKDYQEWEAAVAAFKDYVPQLANRLVSLIESQRQTNRRFISAFTVFTEKCRQSINPNLSEAAVEEMLIQHLLTERIFRTVFHNSDFSRRNAIANEIEKVIDALTSRSFSREEFLKSLDRFYVAIERAAAYLDDFSQKQHFLNAVYEQFFQGYSIKVADTHGIVYTPQPIVDFMVKSVADILQKEFGKSLSDKGVHILDPFVGTGNFIVRAMQEIRKTALEHKYAHELHCNEVMLLPYYIASMNIEHEFYEATGSYQPFEGICMVDTFDLAEAQQMTLFAEENTARVEKQKTTPMFVIIGNPPYNAGQVNENDNNKNRKYPEIDRRVSETYAKDSKATLVRKLNDPYVKAIRWASDRINKDGIVAFVINNSFIDEISFDGMRKHVYQDFNRLYILNLQGNVRKDSMREGLYVGEKHTVFGLAAMVGVTIALFIKNSRYEDHKIYYNTVHWRATRQEKFNLLKKGISVIGLGWQELKPDSKQNWLREGLHEDFETFMPIGTKAGKRSKEENIKNIFKTFSLGISSNRDVIVYDFNQGGLSRRIEQFCKDYNAEIYRYMQSNISSKVDDFVEYTKIQWSRNLKRNLSKHKIIGFDEAHIRPVLYRPFTKKYLYLADIIVDELGQNRCFFPTLSSESGNRMICVSDKGYRSEFCTLAVNKIPDLHFLASRDAYQCFPFYTYDEDGSNRKENITDWSLGQFRTHYADDSISKWDIFHYVYALLHHPDYRERYQANLKRELPRIPFAPDFWPFVEAGRRLAEIHVHYEAQPEYPLKMVETPGKSLDWRVEKMRLSKDKTQIRYNDFLTLDGIPSKSFDYRLGNRSALDWIIDQYRVKTDKRSEIVNDPNRDDDPQYIVRLIGQVITVSVETVEIVEALPELGIPMES